jgi:hypothetical protein
MCRQTDCIRCQQVKEKRRIIWRDYAAAFVAALECVNTEQSQDFATKFIPKALPFLTGEGNPPQQPCHPELAQAGSAWMTGVASTGGWVNILQVSKIQLAIDCQFLI